MRKIKLMLILSILVCFVFSACHSQQLSQQNALPLVTSVDVTYDYGQKKLQRHYTDSDKMDVILFYLYDLVPHGQADEDPERLQGDSCRITVRLSNGEMHIYRQQGSRYLSVDFHPWQKISEAKGSLLYHLVNHIESDL